MGREDRRYLKGKESKGQERNKLSCVSSICKVETMYVLGRAARKQKGDNWERGKRPGRGRDRRGSKERRELRDNNTHTHTCTCTPTHTNAHESLLKPITVVH